MKADNKLQYLVIELAHHLPYSVFGVTAALILIGFFSFVATILGKPHIEPEAYEDLFHVFHPAHVLLSSVTSTAIFWKNEKTWWKALVVGILGSLVICTLSDILIPYVGGLLLGVKMDLHVCVIDTPSIVIPFAVTGMVAGLVIAESIESSTAYTHAAHIFVSSAASIVYLVSFGLHDWVHQIGWVFMITVAAVMIPCCASDIAFPILWIKHPTCIHKH
ncbi:MAG: hypothetical protein U1D99_09680 [Candidatus Omnitrophota bacterium]|nr:hypothetical protein [Candidatus Omnitrophota bacterium]